MSYEIIPASPPRSVALLESRRLPEPAERAGGAARFAWEEFFFAEHHNLQTQRGYESAVRRFLAWAEGQGGKLASISPGMVGKYITGLGGSAAKRNQHLSALRGFFDRLIQRHVVLLNPAASMRGLPVRKRA